MEFSAGQIAALLGGKLYGNAEAKVSDVAPIENAAAGHLSYVAEEKYLPHLAATRAGAVLISSGLAEKEKTAVRRFEDSEQALIIVENARGAMGQLLQLVSKAMNPVKQGIEQPCFVAGGVEVPEDAYIGAFAYIAPGVRLGKGVQIYPNVYIGEHVTIGDNTVLYAGVKVYHHCSVGAGCVLHAGVVVGADGFGFEPDAQGVSEEEFFISEPVRFGTRYMLEYWYWTDTTDTFEGNAVARDYTEQNSPLIIDIPYEPGFYYFGYYDGRPSIIKGELTEWNGHPSVEMKPEAIRKALKYYGGSAWAPRLWAELKQAEAEAKKHKAERKAANRKSMWLDDSDSAPEQAQDRTGAFLFFMPASFRANAFVCRHRFIPPFLNCLLNCLLNYLLNYL